MVDLDAQSNLSTHLGLSVNEDPEDPSKVKGPTVSTYDVLKGTKSVNEAIVHRSPTLHIIPSSLLLSAADLELGGVVGRELILRRSLEKVKDLYDL